MQAASRKESHVYRRQCTDTPTCPPRAAAPCHTGRGGSNRNRTPSRSTGGWGYTHRVRPQHHKARAAPRQAPTPSRPEPARAELRAQTERTSHRDEPRRSSRRSSRQIVPSGRISPDLPPNFRRGSRPDAAPHAARPQALDAAGGAGAPPSARVRFPARWRPATQQRGDGRPGQDARHRSPRCPRCPRCKLRAQPSGTRSFVPSGRISLNLPKKRRPAGARQQAQQPRSPATHQPRTLPSATADPRSFCYHAANSLSGVSIPRQQQPYNTLPRGWDGSLRRNTTARPRALDAVGQRCLRLRRANPETEHPVGQKNLAARPLALDGR